MPTKAAEREALSTGADHSIAGEHIEVEGEHESCDGFDASKVIVDRDKLRELRLSPAAQAVFEAAKGPDALAEIRSRKGGPDHVHRVNPYDLEFEGLNPRDFSPESMRQRVADLARSIAARGVRTALSIYVKDNRLYVNGGETRWRATLHCLNFLNKRIERIPIIISTNEDSVDRMIGQWIDNDQFPFTALESGKLFRDAIDLGAEVVEIAQRIGKPTSYVKERMRLLEMPRWLQEQVRTGAIRADTAYNDIWLPAGEDDKKARQMMSGAIDEANSAGAKRVMPRHIRSVGGGGRLITAAAIREQLASILSAHQRERDGSLTLPAEEAERLLKLAKKER